MTEVAPATAAPRRASPLAALRQRWRLGVVVTVLGFLLGVLIGGTKGASYTAEARVGVGTGSLAATSVAGYSLGAQEIAADYARSVTTDDAKTTLAKTLGNSVSGVSAVNASPVPSSAIIRVDVTADNSALALKAAGEATTNFLNSINAAVDGTSASSVLQQYNALEAQLVPLQNTQALQRAEFTAAQNAGGNARIGAAEQALDKTTLQIDNLTTQAAALNAKYQNLVSQPATENGLRPVQSAYLVGSNRHSLLERWALIGLVLGALIALGLATWADTQQVRRRRLRAAGGLPSTTSTARPLGGVAGVAPATFRRTAPVSVPAIVPEPVVAEEPEPILEPAPELLDAVESEPRVSPEPAAAVDLEPTLSPEPELSAAVTPEARVEPVLVPHPTPVTDADPGPAPDVEPSSAAVPEPEAEPIVAVEPEPIIEPEPVVDVAPEPEPADAVETRPAHQPDPLWTAVAEDYLGRGKLSPGPRDTARKTAGTHPPSDAAGGQGAAPVEDSAAWAYEEPVPVSDLATDDGPTAEDLSLVVLAEGDELPAPVLQLELSELPGPSVHPDQLEVIPEPVTPADATEKDVSEPGARSVADGSESEIPTAPEPAAYDLAEVPPEHGDGPAADHDNAPEPAPTPAPRAMRPIGITGW